MYAPMLAFYAARVYYTEVRKMPGGEGFAFLPLINGGTFGKNEMGRFICRL
ncbi:MAG: hypothetical protein LUE96_04645 [Lachnospiraceae bacterium]|nr:hypothetical protein [Lachnospiraceae bacterium]